MVPESGSTIHWQGASVVPMLTRKSMVRATMLRVAPMSRETLLMVPGPRGMSGREKLSVTASLPPEKLVLRPGPPLLPLPPPEPPEEPGLRTLAMSLRTVKRLARTSSGLSKAAWKLGKAGVVSASAWKPPWNQMTGELPRAGITRPIAMSLTSSDQEGPVVWPRAIETLAGVGGVSGTLGLSPFW